MSSSFESADEARQRVEKNVLDVYQKVNPSIRFLDRSRADFELEGDKRRRLFRDYLKFPLKMFQGARMLDFGSGTGERSIFYNQWGARLTMVEMNPLAVERAGKIFAQYAVPGSEYQFIESSLFDVQLQGMFDIVASDGVLHHTGAKKEGFDKLVSYLKPGGFVFLGLGTTGGNVQRNLQRLVLYHFAKSEEEIVALANRLFSEHLDRAERFGHRSRTAIIYDTYINPQIDTTTMNDILGWFRERNIQYYSSWPGILPMQWADVPAKGDLEGLSMVEGLSALPELLWMAHKDSDKEQTGDYVAVSQKLQILQKIAFDPIASVSPGMLVEWGVLGDAMTNLTQAMADVDPFQADRLRIHGVLQEVLGLMISMQKNDVQEVERFIKTTRYLFRGAGGVGMNFIMGYSKDQNCSQ
ncbi:MAG: methyltransferase domain-containing protein [Magnetococcales bacterium]|nr:methyltransferase domain-containing protein [Magnetococcales bacterium]